MTISAGQRFGKWTVVGEPYSRKDRGYQKCVQCLCECGESRDVLLSALKRGRSRSCIRCAYAARCRHGKSRTPTYSVWSAMMARCNTRTNNAFHEYGGRGIAVCERWKLFENFLADMGERPSAGHSIDRIDNRLGYEPGNCRWATAIVQGQNRRCVKNVEFNGKTQCVAAWARELRINKSTLLSRFKAGCTAEEALR